MVDGKLCLLVWVAALGALALCGSCRDGSTRAVNVVGSTSIQPFAELLAQEYGKKHPSRRVEVQGGGSTAGLQAVANGLADIGMCSRALTADEARLFKPIVIARDGLAVVINPANPVKELTIEQLRGLFSGRIKDWGTVGGKPGVVRPITREEGSGTRESFVHLVMGEEKIAPEALTQESNGAVKELVKGDPAAVGYMSLGLVGEELKDVSVDGTAPTAANVLADRYKLARPLLFVVKGTVRPDVREFIDFVLSPEGQKILESEGLIHAK